MTKTITHIEVPKEWESEDDYSSHRPMLWLSIKNTTGVIFEFGGGFGSTPVISKHCINTTSDNLRVFWSYETDKEWADKVGSVFIDDYLTIKPSQIGMLFIDSKPGEQRKDLVELHKDSADVIILHDTEEGCQNIYGIREVLNSFKYRLNYYPEGNPGTTALSNKINVCEWVQ